jgi:hypothetical protein
MSLAWIAPWNEMNEWRFLNDQCGEYVNGGQATSAMRLKASTATAF